VVAPCCGPMPGAPAGGPARAISARTGCDVTSSVSGVNCQNVV
jgi:hypothetical protein